jgi:cytoskeletal protein CcmA (bactofilin family)
MWRDRKPTVASPTDSPPVLPPSVKPIEEKFERKPEEKAMVETAKASAVSPGDANRTLLGRSLVIKGDISGSEDLVIAGQFEGTLNIQGQCVTVSAEGKVKADIQAARVVIYGSVHGNISVRERVEIFKSGHVVGDIVSPGISIEDGAYFKGKIEIVRDAEPERPNITPLRVKEASTPSIQIKG